MICSSITNIQCGSHVDSRGIVRFCNDFDMTKVRRFYTISNSEEHPIRGWIGHKKETKWFFPVRGRTTVSIEDMADNANADSMRSASVFVLDTAAPSVLIVPPGHWFRLEQYENAEVMVFSDSKVGEYANDDYRRPL